MTRKPRTICAFTLVEMLVVVTVIALMLGIGVGAYISFNRDMTWHASVTTISSLLQACRNSASSDQTPAVLVIDTEPAPDEQGMFICKQVYAATLERVGTWHFEGLASTGGGVIADGSFGQKAAMNGDAAL
ncbi:MAG TPA: prepilin-type N-terminal cleavage/methylation domain-containing protein, partial [Planctomycetota bacterium]|nr:prepilin-type N-terminal cleavage/methylation domain-containing protein [Planctomycetota bacterium]